MELLTQQLLRNTKFDQAIAQLTELGVDHKIEEMEGHSFLHLDYNIKSNKTDLMVKECRGLVLSMKDFSIRRMGFHRFMNYEETGRDKFDHDKSILYQEKCDGSLIILSYYPELNRWIAGTRGRVFPDACIQGTNITFPELFWQIVGKDERWFDKHICYIFELCAPHNRVVVFHETPHVVLLGARVKNGLGLRPDWDEAKPEELDRIAEILRVKRPITYKFNSILECVEHTHNLPASEEGFVIQQWSDDLGRYARAKIKGAAYLAIHNILTAKSLNNLVRLVINSQRSCLDDFPEYYEAYDLVRSIFDEFVVEIQELYDANKGYIDGSIVVNGGVKERRKLFAQSVMRHSMGNVCFALADGKIESIDEWFKNQDTRSGLKKLIENFKIQDRVGMGWSVVEDADEDI